MPPGMDSPLPRHFSSLPESEQIAFLHRLMSTIEPSSDTLSKGVLHDAFLLQAQMGAVSFAATPHEVARWVQTLPGPINITPDLAPAYLEWITA